MKVGPHHHKAGRARADVAGVRRRDLEAAVHPRAHARRVGQGTGRRPGRADRKAVGRREPDYRPRRGGRRGVRIVRPLEAIGTLPAILYMHGGGWVLGNAHTHDRLVRELVGTGAAVAFVEYVRSPEARYPVAIEQGYATAQWIVREGAAHQLDPTASPSPATPSAGTSLQPRR